MDRSTHPEIHVQEPQITDSLYNSYSIRYRQHVYLF